MNSNRLDVQCLLERLENVSTVGDGQWSARCPLPEHEDRRNSLSVSVKLDGTIYVYCHRCGKDKTPDILATVGWTLKDLFPSREERRNNGRPRARIVTSYNYCDESGEMLFQVCRIEPKDFRQRRPDGNGGWTWSTKDVRRVLYRLPELLAADPSQPVFIVEGEKDADQLRPMGLVSTCNPGGAGKWSDAYAGHLQGRHVAIIPDNDDAGRKHADSVARSLHGKAASVRILALPGLPDKGDVSDWLTAGGTVEKLHELVEQTPVWRPPLPDAVRYLGRETKSPTVSLGNITLWVHRCASAHGELRVAVDAVDSGGRTRASDTVNLRSRQSRQRFAKEIADIEDCPIEEADSALLQVIPQVEAATVEAADVGKSGPTFPAVQEWPDPVDGRGLLLDLEIFLTRYVVLPAGAPLIVSAWTLASWVIDQFDRFPHLAVTSPVKRCGKTRLLSALRLLCFRPLDAANISPAALYRASEKFQPTLLIDEAQSLSRRGSESAEALRELLCAGCERTATVLRVGGSDRDELRTFRVYSPKVVALIGQLDDVLADRSISVSMERKTPGDSVMAWRSRRVEREGRELAGKIVRWTQDHSEHVAAKYDSLEPFDLANDRAAEMFGPLQAVVSVADPSRLADLEQATRRLAAGDVDDEAVGIRLLAALREIFADRPFVETADLRKELEARDDEPWGTWSKGKPITAHGLAKLLRPFGVRPQQPSRGVRRGYLRADLEPAWKRYLGGASDTPGESDASDEVMQGRETSDDLRSCDASDTDAASDASIASLDAGDNGAGGKSGAVCQRCGFDMDRDGPLCSVCATDSEPGL